MKKYTDIIKERKEKEISILTSQLNSPRLPTRARYALLCKLNKKKARLKSL